MRVHPRRRALGALAAAGALALTASGCAALSQESDGVSVAAALLPAGVRGRAGRRRPGRRLPAHPARHRAARPRAHHPGDAELAGADLVVYESGFQPAVDDGVEQNAAGEVLDAAERRRPPAARGRRRRPTPTSGSTRSGWPTSADAVADRLAEVDPAGADEYAANADDLRRELTRLDAAYTSGLADCERDTVVVSHDAFGYLAARADLRARRRALPRCGTHRRGPRPAAGPRPRRGDHDGLLRAAGQPG